MIAGFGGGLISHTYVEEELLPAVDRGELAAFERRFARWWQATSRSLGPASSVRAIADVAVMPLLQLLGHDRPAVSAFDAWLIAPMPAANCLLLVASWADPSAASWRQAIRGGLAERHAWTLIANGRSLRIIDCTRSWARASIDFDFEQLVLGPKGIAALWTLARASALGGSGPTSLRSRLDASDAHASRVCRSLGDSVLSALPALTTALAIAPRRPAHRAVAFDQSLTLVYRILFLLFAEARALVPTWNEVYRDAYSIDGLIRRASRSSPGLWKAFQAISRLGHAGCSAGVLEVTAFNGRLFSPRHTPLGEQRHVSDAVMRDVLLALASEQTPHGRRRISYHDLGVEQLGSVYERVLEHEPANQGAAVVLTRTSRQRKSTGSFYTPQALTEFLVRRTLAPLVEARSAEQILRLRIVDPAMGSGAFLVAACAYLADCCEHALIRDGSLSATDVTAAERASLRRKVAEQCLYGVDLNPTAVQLARLSLWLTTLAADRPLTFLDHHLAAGNSLIGARLSDLTRPPRSRAGEKVASLPLLDDQIAEDVSTRVLPIRWQLAAPSESIAIVKDKERGMTLLASPDGPLAKWSTAADAWCAATLWPGAAAPSPGVVSEWIAAATGAPTTLPASQLRTSLQRVRDVAALHSAFHWELAFPEVFFDAATGRIAPDAGFDAVIGNPPWSIVRASKGYRTHTTGHPNSYQLFLDRSLQLVKGGGRIGLVLPSGIATDHGSGALRRRLLERTSIDTWIGFDNRCRIFPVHRSVRFVVLATTNSGSTETLRFRCGLTDVSELHRDDPPLSLSRSRIESWSPDQLSIPEVTNPMALGILSAVADRIPALSDPQGWDVRFGRELNATDDKAQFVRLGSRSGLLPIVEGKQLSPFQVDISRSTHGVAAAPSEQRIAYREVASATNRLTLIAAMLPANVISTHTVFCLKTRLDDESQWCLLGLLNSLVANYLVRLSVTTHVTAAQMSRLRVPRPRVDCNAFSELANLSRALASTGIENNLAPYARLNALTARLYGLSRDEDAFVVDTFPLVPKPTRDRCLSVWSNDNSHGITEPQKHGNTLF